MDVQKQKRRNAGQQKLLSFLLSFVIGILHFFCFLYSCGRRGIRIFGRRRRIIRRPRIKVKVGRMWRNVRKYRGRLTIIFKRRRTRLVIRRGRFYRKSGRRIRRLRTRSRRYRRGRLRRKRRRQRRRRRRRRRRKRRRRRTRRRRRRRRRRRVIRRRRRNRRRRCVMRVRYRRRWRWVYRRGNRFVFKYKRKRRYVR